MVTRRLGPRQPLTRPRGRRFRAGRGRCRLLGGKHQVLAFNPRTERSGFSSIMEHVRRSAINRVPTRGHSYIRSRKQTSPYRDGYFIHAMVGALFPAPGHLIRQPSGKTAPAGVTPFLSSGCSFPMGHRRATRAGHGPDDEEAYTRDLDYNPESLRKTGARLARWFLASFASLSRRRRSVPRGMAG